MASLRIPLVETIESRDTNLDKDAIIVNAYIEASPDCSKFAVKRPGETLKVGGDGTGYGIFAYGSYVYKWDAGNTATTPTATLVSSL